MYIFLPLHLLFVLCHLKVYAAGHEWACPTAYTAPLQRSQFSNDISDVTPRTCSDDREQLLLSSLSSSGSAADVTQMDARARDESESMSSLSSSSLQRRVSHEARETSLVAKVRILTYCNIFIILPLSFPPSLQQVQSLQHEAVTLRGMIAGGKADIGHIQSTLYKMLREHAHLATTVATVATSLEVVNDLSKGRAAKHIAISHTSLGSEVLHAEHIGVK